MKPGMSRRSVSQQSKWINDDEQNDK
jgi:hypothetical protein